MDGERIQCNNPILQTSGYPLARSLWNLKDMVPIIATIAHMKLIEVSGIPHLTEEMLFDQLICQEQRE